jgi:septum site-determining protein MinC
LRSLLEQHGINLRSVSYDPAGGGEELARRRAARPKREVQLSDNARSLAADFAGARADIAERRKRGHASVRRPSIPNVGPVAPVVLAPAPVPLTPTHFHSGTMRGGQSLHHLGNVVVVGDVNPGAEIVATGDIVVFGALRGVAHAGAQGETRARVHAIELAPTQLRIATYIAADTSTDTVKRGPETACVQNGRIAIFARENAPQ